MSQQQEGPYKVESQGMTARNGEAFKLRGATGYVLTNASKVRADKMCAALNAAFRAGVEAGAKGMKESVKAACCEGCAKGWMEYEQESTVTTPPVTWWHRDPSTGARFRCEAQAIRSFPLEEPGS